MKWTYLAGCQANTACSGVSGDGSEAAGPLPDDFVV